MHLAKLLRLDEIVSVAVPSIEQEDARDLVRAREDVRGDLMRARHRVSKLLLRQGIVYYGGQAWTRTHLVWLRAQHFDTPGLQLAFDAEHEAVLQAVARRDRLDAAIVAMAAASEFTPVVHRLGCLRGISTLTAFGLAVEVGNWDRLTGSTIGSYLGLVPTECSSGQSRSQGSITKTGNTHARRLLVEAAWHHLKPYRTPGPTMAARWERAPAAARARGHAGNQRLHQRWLHFTDRKKRPVVANVAIARELAGCCWSLAVMSAGQREALTVLARSSTAAHREVKRATVLLMAADGVANSKIASAVGVTPVTVRSWRGRFADEGLSKFGQVREGRGRKPGITAAKVEEIVRLTQHEKPSGETHWSCRSMAKAVGVSPATVQRIWSGRGLKPHLVKTFKLSNDPRFEEKLIDVVGLYLNPPEKAVVLCMDEKTSIQALDHTQASLPMTKGRAGTVTSDYKRHGTTTLFAALDVLTGSVIGSCMDQHRHEEFLKFLRTIDREVPKGLAVHMILDNYATHKHKNVVAWLAKHPRFQLHFTPTSSSWLNLVERWFRELTGKALRRGVFHSVPDLIASIEEYMKVHNNKPKAFVWTATAESILTKVRRGRVALDQAVSQ